MRSGVAIAVAAAGALLMAALIGMETAAERQPSAELTWPAAMPALAPEIFEDPPSVSELDGVGNLERPALTR